MRVFLSILLIFVLCASCTFAEEITDYQTNEVTAQFEKQNLRIQKSQDLDKNAKLYAPNFVIVGAEADFRVLTYPNVMVKLTLDYGSKFPKQTFEQMSNSNGMAVFTPVILNKDELVGKSVDIIGVVMLKSGKCQTAILQTEKGTPAPTNRVYIADKDSAKGFSFSPIQSFNAMLLRNNYSEIGGYDPINNQLSPVEIPVNVQVKRMREAQDNVRNFTQNTNYSN